MNMVSDAQYSEYQDATTVGFAGDWHGNTGWAIHAIKSIAGRDVKILYHAGDFGLWGGGDGAAYLRKINQTLSHNDMLIIVTPGNHENYDMLDKFPVNNFGFMVRNDIPHVWFTPRGHVWRHQDAVIGSLGGAGSIDINKRVQGKSWWWQEEITDHNVDQFRSNIEENLSNGVDIMVTHEAPAGITLGTKGGGGVPPEIEHYCYKQRILVRDAVDMATPKTLIHGHWHKFYRDTLNGVSELGLPYSTDVIGLNMDGTESNLITGQVSASGIIDIEVLYK